MIWKEAAVAEGTEENHGTPSMRIIGVQNEIRTGHHPIQPGRYQQTLRNRVLLEKLIIAQLVEKGISV
jgi:hypothetical protein